MEAVWKPLGEALVTGEGLWYRQQYFSSPVAVRNQWYDSGHPLYGKTVTLYLHAENGSLSAAANDSFTPCYPLQPVYARLLSLSDIARTIEQKKVTFLWKKTGRQFRR